MQQHSLLLSICKFWIFCTFQHPCLSTNSLSDTRSAFSDFDLTLNGKRQLFLKMYAIVLHKVGLGEKPTAHVSHYSYSILCRQWFSYKTVISWYVERWYWILRLQFLILSLQSWISYILVPFVLAQRSRFCVQLFMLDWAAAFGI